MRRGSPALQAGMRPQDLIVGASGKPIQLLRELTDILGAMKPGDKLPLEVVRGARRMRINIVLGTPPGAAQSGPAQPSAVPSINPPDFTRPGSANPNTVQPTPPAPNGLGAGRTESIPPPPSDLNAAQKEIVPAPPSGDLVLPSPAEGPALSVPAAPVAPAPPAAQPAAPNSTQFQIEELRRDVETLKRQVEELKKALAKAQKK
jgi:hypothetical protein